MEDVKQFHEYISDHIAMSDYNQLEIAKKLNFNNPNMITMIKKGKTKLPLEYVPGMASILRLDPVHLVRMWFLEYDPVKLKVIESIFGDSITKNEKRIINEIRIISKNADPEVRTIAQLEKLREFAKTLVA